MSSGNRKYVPKIVIEEIDDIKRSERINKDCVAFRKMVEHSRIGREVERIMRLDFSQPPLSTKNIFKRGKKGWL